MRKVAIETLVEVVKIPGEHVNYNASKGARTRTRAYDQFSAGMRTRHNRNGSVSTTSSNRWYARVRCDDGVVYDLDMKKLAPGKRLTAAVRDSIIRDVEDYIVEMPMHFDDSGNIDYQELLNTLNARKGASTTE